MTCNHSRISWTQPLVCPYCQLEAQAKEIEGMRKALEPFAKFATAFERKPVNCGGHLYGIHTGTEWEAEIKLSDCIAARAAIGQSVERKDNS